MKLLLTSGGVTNASIARALRRLLGSSPREVRISFVPTAAFAEVGEKSWFVAQLTNLHRFGFSDIDIVEPSLPHTQWRKRLAASDVVFVGGGNTYFLLEQSRKSGFADWLVDELGERVYLGASAGSILVTPTIVTPANTEQNTVGLQDTAGVGLVHFELLPHVTDAAAMIVAESYAKVASRNFYALDDPSAVLVRAGTASIVGEGHARFFER